MELVQGVDHNMLGMMLGGTISAAYIKLWCVSQGSNSGLVLFLLFTGDLPLSWEKRNDLFVDDATFCVKAVTCTNV